MHERVKNTHADERLQIFAIRASGLKLVSSVRVDGRKDIQFLILRRGLKVHVLTSLRKE